MLRFGSLLEHVGGGAHSGGVVLVGGGSAAMVFCESKPGEDRIWRSVLMCLAVDSFFDPWFELLIVLPASWVRRRVGMKVLGSEE